MWDIGTQIPIVIDKAKYVREQQRQNSICFGALLLVVHGDKVWKQTSFRQLEAGQFLAWRGF